MANEEHFAILKQGVDVWNEWREENPHIRPDLSLISLEGMNLREVDFQKADLHGANLCKTNLTVANLAKGNFDDVLFIGAILRQTNLVEASLTVAELDGADLQGANLEKARLNGVLFREADLRGASLSNADLSGVEYRGAGGFFLHTVGANLTKACLCDTRLQGTDLTGTDLSETDLSNAWIGWTRFGNTALSTAKGLDGVKHKGPSTIGIDTIYRSKGKTPEAFLRGCGVPDTFIEFARSLAQAEQPIDYYSCFISHSSKDEDFAQRLHADLQDNGVRCWFAPEDMKIGDKIRQRIDESIRIHDKLLLVLSENSTDSQWVEKEVETAWEEERQRGETVLFPVRLDDSVMETDQAWAADIRCQRHIEDFREWKEHDSYQDTFERLLRDLKAEE